ncbi:hypothetical protein QNI16_17240 [Cytophagaceae bacterium YF14B1]|uniref:S9 family peptidase n=1 Tax=Xanthocytophaga flava TaxID=3048013 RepID=A0AAE3U9H0_9BACT|nr:hypothetical protein [Xanthocytophaga flavus]MDJ1482253.1 hypothetical protein [Xanthocytophaga flavus]
MKKTALLIFLLSIALATSVNAQNKPAAILEPYTYKTKLKGGYRILFIANDSLQYLYLKKGNKSIAEISSTSIGLPYMNLGHVGADFTNYFVLVHSFGPGNSQDIELIEKTTGKNLLKLGASWIGADEEKELLLYSDKGVPSKKDRMVLYNVLTKQKQFFAFPNDIFDDPEVLSRIELEKITEKQLIIKYDINKGYKTKVYAR